MCHVFTRYKENEVSKLLISVHRSTTLDKNLSMILLKCNVALVHMKNFAYDQD